MLRHFGPKKELARERFREFVVAGIGLEYPVEFESPAESGILGSEEFVDDTIHRIGMPETSSRDWKQHQKIDFNAEAMIAAVEQVFGLARDKFCGPVKTAKAVMAKEVLIVTGREAGASIPQLASITAIDASSVSRRCDAAKLSLTTNSKLAYAKLLVEQDYCARIAESNV